MSIVMPRCFSSLSRSASMPVRALTRAVLPWSMWPAVPRMMDFICFCRSAPNRYEPSGLKRVLLLMPRGSARGLKLEYLDQVHIFVLLEDIDKRFLLFF